VKVTIDGAALPSELVGEPCPVNPGSHQIVGMRGAERVSVELSAAEGEKKSAVLRFEGPVTAAEPGAGAARPVAGESRGAPSKSATNDAGSTRRTVAWIAVGVGGASVALGAATAFVALGKKHALDDDPNCRGNQCLYSEQDAVDSYNSLRTVSTLALAGGIVIAGVGVTLLLTAPKSGAPNVALWASPRSAGFAANF
jgi:hypothetical protein